LTAPANMEFTHMPFRSFSGAAGTAVGDSSTIAVNVYSGTTASGTPVEVLTATATAGSFTVNAAPPLADGTYTARAQQGDAAGNTGRKSVVKGKGVKPAS